jgi:predicted peptidase
MKLELNYRNPIYILFLCLVLAACEPGRIASPTLVLVPTAVSPTPSPTVERQETAVEGEKKGVFLQKVYQSENGSTIPYRLRIPENTNPDQRYPLLVFLHGAGELGDDNVRQLANFPANFLNPQNKEEYAMFVLAPQCPSHDAWASFPNYPYTAQTSENPTTAMRLTIELIENLLAEYNIDPDRVYVTGLSLGGEGTFDIVSRRPDLFAAAVPICGIADVEKAESMKDVPFWVFHGEKDDINSVDYSRAIVKALVAAGAAPRYTEYEDAGHSIWNNAYNEPDLLPWLFSQRK